MNTPSYYLIPIKHTRIRMSNLQSFTFLVLTTGFTDYYTSCASQEPQDPCAKTFRSPLYAFRDTGRRVAELNAAPAWLPNQKHWKCNNLLLRMGIEPTVPLCRLNYYITIVLLVLFILIILILHINNCISIFFYLIQVTNCKAISSKP